MTFEIQKVSEIDLPQLADEMYMDPNYLKRVREMMAKDELVIFAAKDGERYVGRCSLWLAPADEAELREEIPGVPLVNALEVHPEYYRQGIASLLIAALEEESKRRGKTGLALGVEPQNMPGRKLYEKLGFVYRTISGSQTYPCFWIETQPDGSEQRHTIHALLMVKELS